MTDDPAAFLDRLAADARRAAPGLPIEVETERSMGDRLRGRPGRTIAVRLDGEEHRWSLAHEHGRWRTEVARVVGGIVIAREQPPLGTWLDGFAAEVAAQAARITGDAAAARRAVALLRGDALPFAVDREDVDGGLTDLLPQVRSRLPADAAATVERIADLLRQALPRATGDAAALVRRTASVYLPDTLRAWAALPPGWSAPGGSADDALRDQLAAIEQAATRMRDAAVADDADALLLNGLFLEQRFDA